MKLSLLMLLIASANAWNPASRPPTTATKTASAPSFLRPLTSVAAAAVISWTALVSPATANEARVIGQLQGSGLVFKDILQIESFDDPKVRGVTLYISNFQRPLTERIGSNFFSDPSSASVACAKTGPIAIADNLVPTGEQVFQESKSLLFKELKVQRIYDQPKNTMIYVSYTTRLDKGDDDNKSRFKSSLCAVPLDGPSVASPQLAP